MRYLQVYFGFRGRNINTCSDGTFYSLDLKQGSRYSLPNMDNSFIVFKV